MTHGTIRVCARKRIITAITVLLASVCPAVAIGQGTPLPLPPGVTPLPQALPPVGPQAPLPAPALRIPSPEKPDRVSPGLDALPAALRKRPLTIQDAVAIALATNRTLALAGEALLRAQGRTLETRSAFNPTLAATLTYLRLNQANSIEFPDVNNPGQTQVIPLLNDSQRQIGVQATLPIDLAGLLRAANDQARFQEVALRLDINRVRNQIVLDVKTAFYDALRAQALVEVAEANLRNTVARYEEADKKLRAGTVARFDVIRAQTDIAQAQQQWIQARNTLSLSLAALNNAMGIDINTPITLTAEGAVETPPGVAPPGSTIPAPPITGLALPSGLQLAVAGKQGTPDKSAPPADATALSPADRIVAADPLPGDELFETLRDEALALRPEIMQADANIAAAKKGIVLARRSVLPSFGLSWNLNYAPDTAGFAPIITTWQAVAQVTIPLYDGGLARARSRQARADVATAETNRRAVVDQIVLEVRQAYLNLLQARDRVAVANQALAQAQEAFRLARVRYEAGVTAVAGVSPQIELSDAQTALVQAQSNQINALYDYNNARARLDRAVGRYAFVNNGPGYPAPPSGKVLGHSSGGGNP
ncbi:MAG: TolC family protein [Chloroherpetonaceae bacterium]|nr:TolC family protein [Chthonomonadaceae bacterium]MDW8208887.1 TolC family protein [Chloroherpetonaceae bacterium]